MGSRHAAYRPTATLVCVVIAALLVALVGGCGGDGDRSGRVAPPASVAPAGSGGVPDKLPVDSRQLSAGIDQAQGIIDDPSSTSLELARAGLFEQLATASLGDERLGARRTTLAMLDKKAAASMRTNLAAAAALAALVAPGKGLPDWRIALPPGPNVLLRYYRAAQSRFGVGWQYLAAIEFVETRFGRVQGLSSAGAKGPMQFLAGTWARYGQGRIDNQRDAILAAARFLVANGARASMPRALYSYNNSRDYVTAIQDYAAQMRADPRAYYGFYHWQVIYAHLGGDVILPVGYPKVRPIRVG